MCHQSIKFLMFLQRQFPTQGFTLYKTNLKVKDLFTQGMSGWILNYMLGLLENQTIYIHINGNMKTSCSMNAIILSQKTFSSSFVFPRLIVSCFSFGSQTNQRDDHFCMQFILFIINSSLYLNPHFICIAHGPTTQSTCIE